MLLAATCADAMARACCSKEEVAWRLATVMAALLGRIGGGPYSQTIMFVKKGECTSYMYISIQHCRVVQVKFPCRTENDIEPHTVNRSHTVFSFPTEI